MSSILKLSKMIIHRRNIAKIDIKSAAYKLTVEPNNFISYALWRQAILSNDSIDITICKTEDADDYEIITNWLKKGSNQTVINWKKTQKHKNTKVIINR